MCSMYHWRKITSIIDQLQKTNDEKIAILVTRVTCWSWSDLVATNRHTVLCYATEICVASS